MSYLYIGSPYTHADPEVREARYLAVEAYTAELLRIQQWVYSPIVHCHNLARRHDLPKDAAFWARYNNVMLCTSHEFRILMLPNWEESIGIQGESRYAKNRGIPIENVLLPEGLLDDSLLRKLAT